jgi:hypothetical protein
MILAVTLGGVLSLAVAQPGTQAFAGTWVAELSGTTYVRLAVSNVGGTVTSIASR